LLLIGDFNMLSRVGEALLPVARPQSNETEGSVQGSMPHKPQTLRIHAVSLGCAKNLVDTETMLGSLQPGITLVQSPDQADVVLVNTCSFIRPAVEESLETVLALAREVAEVPDRPPLVVTGCLPARYGVGDLEAEIPEVDLWLGLDQQRELADHLQRLLPAGPSGPERSRGCEVSPQRMLTTGPGYAYLKISEGCRHQCNFCTIPSIRGKLRSRPAEDLIREARQLLGSGARELCVVAQDVTAYGRDLGMKQGLAELLGSLAGLQGLDWLRLLYCYPAGLTTELLSFLQDLGQPFVPYFDIPLQHAHPDILSAMGRPFSGDPRRVVDLVRAHFPEASLRTSIIAGFPGETEAHFRTLLRFVREVRFDHLGVFEFHPEEGTRAAAMNDQVQPRLRRERRDALMQEQAEVSAAKLKGLVGRYENVLVERPDPEWPTLYRGRAWFQAPESDGITYVSGERLRPGEMVRAQIQDAGTYDLTALA
jgi:tRNA-2-methylthio-N6-dimethylallyladenosine synthase/ribosomal protein S12 methylthiotransferase